jgi:hypothetical protein
MIDDKEKLAGLKMSIQDKLKNGFSEYLEKQEEHQFFKKDNSIVENKIDNYLFESDEVKQVKKLLKRVYSKFTSSNDIKLIQYYSSLFPVIVSSVLSDKNTDKVITLIS